MATQGKNVNTDEEETTEDPFPKDEAETKNVPDTQQQGTQDEKPDANDEQNDDQSNTSNTPKTKEDNQPQTSPDPTANDSAASAGGDQPLTQSSDPTANDSAASVGGDQPLTQSPDPTANDSAASAGGDQPLTQSPDPTANDSAASAGGDQPLTQSSDPTANDSAASVGGDQPLTQSSDPTANDSAASASGDQPLTQSPDPTANDSAASAGGDQPLTRSPDSPRYDKISSSSLSGSIGDRLLSKQGNQIEDTDANQRADYANIDSSSVPKSGSRTNTTSEEQQNNSNLSPISTSNPNLQSQSSVPNYSVPDTTELGSTTNPSNNIGGVSSLINTNITTNQNQEENPLNSGYPSSTTATSITSPTNTTRVTGNIVNDDDNVETNEKDPFIASGHTVSGEKKKSGKVDVKKNKKNKKPTDSQNKFLPASKPLQSIGLLAGIILIVSLFQLIIGVIYKNDCSLNPYIPLYLIVAGVLGIVLAIVLGALRSLSLKAKSPPTVGLFFEYIIFVLYAAVFFVGSVWSFSDYSTVQSSDPSLVRTYCNSVVFYSAFVTSIILGIVLVVGFILSCLIKASAEEKPVPTEERV